MTYRQEEAVTSKRRETLILAGSVGYFFLDAFVITYEFVRP